MLVLCRSAWWCPTIGNVPRNGAQGEQEGWLLSLDLDSRRRRFNHLFLGGEVDLVGVVSTISSLLTCAGT